MNLKEQGKKNRENGRQFEARVRKDLTDRGYTVCKFDNNVEWDKDNINRPPEERIGKLIPAKSKFNPVTGRLMMGKGGFPDFVRFRRSNGIYFLDGVEAKTGKYLTQDEKDKCDWLLEKGIFSKILIAYKDKKTKEVIYEKYENKKNKTNR